MLNKLITFIRRHELLQPGDAVVCAVSGGADSVALLFGLYLLKDKLGIRLSAAHFNHRLRAEESDRDEAFVREFCSRYDIPLTVGSGAVKPGKKGLEAAARDARYAFLRTFPGKIATAHTADDNAETVLLHMLRGSGLKGLGGIAPVSGNLIRPMLEITRQDVEAFLAEWSLPHVEDSSNGTEDFLRNRIRHNVMPLLRQENPRLAENVSAMALRLRQDEACLDQMAGDDLRDVETLRTMHPALRSRALEKLLKASGVREPEAEHIALVEALVFSDKPSAQGNFPGGITLGRHYGTLVKLEKTDVLTPVPLGLDTTVELPELGLLVSCQAASEIVNTSDTFTVQPVGGMVLRAREPGDALRLAGGRKAIKKLFIDLKIPAQQRLRIPVLADSAGVLGVYGIGADHDRRAEELPAVTIRFQKIEK